MSHNIKQMLSLKTLGGAAIAGTLLASGMAVTAMADDRRGDRDRQSSAFHAGERFARADVDGDRMVSLDEFQAGATERFTSMDADGDGLVTPAEAVAERQRASEERAARRMARIDTNEDGALSLEEVMAASEERFARMDRNDDGTLEAREMRRAASRADRDERRERFERQANPTIQNDDVVVEQTL